MKIKKILLTSALILSTYSAIAQTQVIAHRGYWKTDGSAQNSIAALLKADSIGCYGSEFDVWLTADDKLVVNHDPIFKLKSMERSTAATLTSLKLDNGEQLPTLEQYLKAAKKDVYKRQGRNFAAGMSGGVAYVWNKEGNFDYFCNMEMVELSLIEEASYRKELHELIRQHYLYTGSKLARIMLDDWNRYADEFIQVVPIE